MFYTIYFYVRLDLFFVLILTSKDSPLLLDMFTREFISSPTRDVLASRLSRLVYI